MISPLHDELHLYEEFRDDHELLHDDELPHDELLDEESLSELLNAIHDAALDEFNASLLHDNGVLRFSVIQHEPNRHDFKPYLFLDFLLIFHHRAHYHDNFVLNDVGVTLPPM